MVYGVCASATTENIDIGTDIGRLVVVTALSRAWPAGDGPEASVRPARGCAELHTLFPPASQWLCAHCAKNLK